MQQLESAVESRSAIAQTKLTTLLNLMMSFMGRSMGGLFGLRLVLHVRGIDASGMMLVELYWFQFL